jgi:chemotaxis protein histidine kinase CheA
MSDDLVREFLVESTENLDTLDRELVLLEKDPRDAKLLASVFRTIHTIKGTCGFLGFTKLEKVAHAGENLLASLRDGKLELRTEIASGLMSMVDAVRHMLEQIASTGQDGHADYRDLIETLTNLQQPFANPIVHLPLRAALLFHEGSNDPFKERVRTSSEYHFPRLCLERYRLWGGRAGPGPHDSSLNEVSCGDLEEAVTKPMLQSQIDLRS